MEDFNKIISSDLLTRIIHSLIIIIASLIIYRFIIYIINKGQEKNHSKLFTSNKSKTYLNLTKSVIRSIYIIITILIVLQVNGINVSSILAGVGIFSAILGLAIQDWLKDIIRGSTIISDDYFKVGDYVKYKDIEGKVLIIGLKTTKILAIKTGNIISIANRNIDEIEVISNLLYIRVPLPYELNVDKSDKVMNDVIDIIKDNNGVNGCRYLGVSDFLDSSIIHLIEITCNQDIKYQVRRDALKSILLGLEKNKVSIPYNQLDIHNK